MHGCNYSLKKLKKPQTNQQKQITHRLIWAQDVLWHQVMMK